MENKASVILVRARFFPGFMGAAFIAVFAIASSFFKNPLPEFLFISGSGLIVSAVFYASKAESGFLTMKAAVVYQISILRPSVLLRQISVKLLLLCIDDILQSGGFKFSVCLCNGTFNVNAS